jgi:hypothetical protein
MTNEEQEWVDALTGKAIESASTGEQLLASSVRKAFLARRESLEADALNFEPEKLELIRRKLNQAGLINETQLNRKKSNFFDLIIGIVSIKSGQAAVQKIGILVVILFIGFAISNTYLSNRADEQMLYRGAGSEAYIIDENPEARLAMLISELDLLKAEYSTEKLSYGRTLVKIKFTKEVEQFLLMKNIQIQEVDGYYSIFVSPPKVKKSQ